MSDYHDTEPVTVETIVANKRHDAERHTVCMDPKVRLRSRVVETGVLGELTDKRISYYQERGWYSESFKQARKELWAKKAKKRGVRDGNFLVLEDGRKVYSPI